MLNPSVVPARSFLYRELQKRGAALGEVNGYGCAMRIGSDAAAEDAQARSLGLCDLTPLKRIGFKGWATAEWLIGQGATLEDAPNRVYPQDDGARIARLSKGEFVILGDLHLRSTLPDRLGIAWSINNASGCFRVPREDASAWLCLSGEHAGAMFAKVCGIDMRPQHFANNQIAQTSLARMNAIIMRNDRGATLAFDLVFDLASAVYLWNALLDAMTEFDGKPVGLEAVRGLG
ncbi:MAG: sarcosine oxidase [Alphaproteobacteria bacterium]|nr:sarcosine oxidase [Alphaproteobacteria bacterium]